MTLLLLYSEAKLKSNDNKSFVLLRPWSVRNASGKCLSVWLLLYVSLKHIVIINVKIHNFCTFSVMLVASKYFLNWVTLFDTILLISHPLFSSSAADGTFFCKIFASIFSFSRLNLTGLFNFFWDSPVGKRGWFKCLAKGSYKIKSQFWLKLDLSTLWLVWNSAVSLDKGILQSSPPSFVFAFQWIYQIYIQKTKI